MEISPLSLARTQFALSLNFHVLFAAFAMALAWVLCLFKYQSNLRPDSAWTAAYRFWVRIFALSFFVALASALPVLVEFGVLWPALMERAGNVAGPIVACGITTVFVTKSVFFGVMLFGQRRVSPSAHLASVFMVALGLTATVFWEVVLQSWSHVPSGTVLVEGRLRVQDWIEVIMNSALIWCMLLYVTGGILTLGVLMQGLTAWQARRRPLEENERLVYRVGLYLTFVAIALQLFALDGSLRLMARIHPLAAASIMGYWDGQASPDMIWLGIPGDGEQANRVLIGTEGLAARWLGLDDDSKRIGLDMVTESTDLPAVNTLFYLARLIFVGTLFLLMMSILTVYMMWRRGEQAEKYPGWILRTQIWTAGLGAFIWLCVWNLMQTSQHAYFVSGMLLTGDLVTNASSYAIGAGLLVIGLLYLVLFSGFMQMLLHAARFGVVPVRKPGVKG